MLSPARQASSLQEPFQGLSYLQHLQHNKRQIVCSCWGIILWKSATETFPPSPHYLVKDDHHTDWEIDKTLMRFSFLWFPGDSFFLAPDGLYHARSKGDKPVQKCTRNVEALQGNSEVGRLGSPEARNEYMSICIVHKKKFCLRTCRRYCVITFLELLGWPHTSHASFLHQNPRFHDYDLV